MQFSQHSTESAAKLYGFERRPASRPQAGFASRTMSVRDREDDLTPQVRHPLPAILAHALDWLNNGLDEPVQLASLAAAAGVRPRTLEVHFRTYLGTTPLGWVRQRRLTRARQQLL